jgi:hypothetical protein
MLNGAAAGRCLVCLVVSVASTSKSARIRIVELYKRGQKIRSFTATIATTGT